MKKYLLIFLVNVSILCGQGITTITYLYESSDALFPNPERGFVTQRSSSINETLIRNLRLSNITVVQKLYKIPSQFRLDSLSQEYLANMANDFNETRKGGGKLVIRYSYTDSQNGQDAPLEIVLTHIKQIEPLLREYADIIAYVEAGFIGAWGEWYYSTNGLNNTTDRRTVLYALLDALPEKRSVLVRTPDYKRKIFQDNTPISAEEAFSGSKKARTGAHNDCFLASETDYGTYVYNDIEGDKNYLNQDNRYVAQGGETCAPSAYSDCGHAIPDLERLHWSILNRDYNQAVLNEWESANCMLEAKQRLGYRFELQRAVLNDSVAPAGTFNVLLDIYNGGFASPYNPRNLEIVLRDTLSGEIYRIVTDQDPRYWMSGDTTHIEIAGGIRADMPQGVYEVLLHLADPEPLLHDRFEYAIRLANTNIWEDTTGFNSLGHYLKITPEAVSDPYAGDTFFEKDVISSGLINLKETRPKSFKLLENYPNPFNGSTQIQFELDSNSWVELSVFSAMGSKISTIRQGYYNAGIHTVKWQPANIASGIYYYKLMANNNAEFGKALYIK